MVDLWIRQVEKSFKISEEAGQAKLAEVPQCYLAEVTEKLIEKGVITTPVE